VFGGSVGEPPPGWGRILRQGGISERVEWFNVTYRSVITPLLVLVVLGLGAGSYWFYFHKYVPRERARSAISRAETRIAVAVSMPENTRLTEIVGNARVHLGEAREVFTAGGFEGALVAAIRAENLATQAIEIAGGNEENSRVVRIQLTEGEVRVKLAGSFSWRDAEPGAVLRVGDQVKTSSNGSAELLYFDGTVTTIRPGSLLEIRDLYEDPVTKVRRVREKLTFGEINASTQKRNVAGSYHEVTTDRVAARTDDQVEFRVSFDKEQETSTIDVFGGEVEVSTGSTTEHVAAGERIRAGSDGKLSPKEPLPGVPRLLAPSDQRVFIFEEPANETLTLNWESVKGSERYRLMISNRSMFTDLLYDAERSGNSAAVDGVALGSYFWRVAAIGPDGVEGPFSEVRRFRVSSQHIRDKTDNEPPKLEIEEFVPIGQMVIINGATEPGATLWVDNQKIDLYENGSFNAVVRLRTEGANDVRIVAQDTAGNETVVTRSAFVEVY